MESIRESPCYTNISTSTLRPDLVLILNNNITIIELTIPSNNKEALQAAFDRKFNKLPYLHLISDLESCNYKVTYTTLEIRLLGRWTKQAIKSLSLIPNVNKKIASSILLHLSKISISCSYHIFNSPVGIKINLFIPCKLISFVCHCHCNRFLLAFNLAKFPSFWVELRGRLSHLFKYLVVCF